MNNIKITVVFVLFFIFFVPVLLSLGIRYIPDQKMPDTGGSVKVDGAGFKIINNKDNLVGIILRIKNPNRTDSVLKLQVKDKRGALVAESSINSLSIVDGSEVRFSFGPVKAGNYEIVLSSNDMEVYLDKNTNMPAYSLLYKPESRINLVGEIYCKFLAKTTGFSLWMK